jgi:hypothetical protein
MEARPKTTTNQFQLRQWNQQNLTKDDYKFAVSSDPKNWNSLTHRLWNSGRQAAKSVVADMFDWELFRELDAPHCPECKRGPFLAVGEHEDLISRILDRTTLPKPSQIEPLREVALAEAVQRNQDFSTGLDAGVRLHALEIEWDEQTDVTVQRFRNWLVALKRAPDPRTRIGREINAAGVSEINLKKRGLVGIREALARRGRSSYDALLRALAVRRLKEAGHNRKQAEELLGLAQYALNQRLPPNVKHPDRAPRTDHWNMLPRLALREIESFVLQISPLYAPGRKISTL